MDGRLMASAAWPSQTSKPAAAPTSASRLRLLNRCAASAMRRASESETSSFRDPSRDGVPPL